MAESIIGWFIVREKYCPLAKKVRLISHDENFGSLILRIEFVLTCDSNLLDQLTSSDYMEFDSNMYFVLLQRTSIFSSY